MFMRLLFAALFCLTSPMAAIAEGALDRAKRGEAVSVFAADPRMKAAFAKARSTLPQFLKLLDEEPPYAHGFSIKMNIPALDGHAEFFWITSVQRDGSGFKGVIANRPNYATHVSMGDEIRFSRRQIVDWTYRDTRTGYMEGNFTGCAIASRETPGERKRFLEAVKLRCR